MISNSTHHPPIFLLDAMLGRLARWLRLLGFDTAYSNDLSDSDILQLGKSQNRIILTSDNQLYHKLLSANLPSILVENTDLKQQLTNIFNVTKTIPNPKLYGTRCSKCNSRLNKITKDKIEDYLPKIKPIPSSILALHENFWICSSCHQAFWPGHMWKRVIQTISTIFEG